jgi:hypothetical protein
VARDLIFGMALFFVSRPTDLGGAPLSEQKKLQI